MLCSFQINNSSYWIFSVMGTRVVKSVLWLRWSVDDPELISQQGQEFFLCSKTSRQALGSIQPLIQWITGTLSSGIKRPGRQVFHSPPSTFKVKNRRSCTSTPLTCLHSMYRNEFTHTFCLLSISYILHYKLSDIFNFPPFASYTLSFTSRFSDRIWSQLSSSAENSRRPTSLQSACQRWFGYVALNTVYQPTKPNVSEKDRSARSPAQCGAWRSLRFVLVCAESTGNIIFLLNGS